MFWIVMVRPSARSSRVRIMFRSMPFLMILDLKIADGAVFLKSLLMKREFIPKDFRIFLEKFNNSLVLILRRRLKFRMLIAKETFPLWLRNCDSRTFLIAGLRFSGVGLSRISMILMVPPSWLCRACGSAKSSLKIAVSIFFSTKFFSPKIAINSEKHK